MNEQAKEVLAQLMQRALNGVDAAVDFSQQQIPVVIEQLLTWHFVESVVFFAMGCGFIVLAIWTLKAGIKKSAYASKAFANKERWALWREGSELSSNAHDLCKLMPFSSIAPFLIGLTMIASNLTWLKIWLAAKLYLLEYGASLIK